MNVKTACQYIILSLVSTGVPAPVQAIAASGSGSEDSAASGTHEGRQPAEPGTVNPNETTRRVMPPTGKAGQEPVPRDRTHEIEERVQSGPVDQEEVSGRLEQLQGGLNPLSGETGTGQSAQ